MFKNMDLYKGIILASLLLLPVSLGYLWWVNGKKEEAEKGLAAATAEKNGELVRIGEILQRLDTVEKNAARGGEREDSRIYFEKRITQSSEGGISANDFTISNEVETPVSGNNAAVDQVVSINFRRLGKEFDLPRAFIHAVILNCEQFGGQVWKLRSLKMRNTEAFEASRGGGKAKAPSKTVADDWRIEKLEFARREPKKKS